ncbi:MAG: cytidylyltransferase domain-containing protein [Phycisphaerales bacterium JB060]
MSANAESIAVILARKGSSGLRGKNRAPVAGRPCVAWTFEHAIATPGLDRIGVSTDDTEIGRLALEAGLEFWLRPPDLASETASIDAAAREAISRAHEVQHIGRDAAVMLLYANVPVRPAGLLGRALDLFHQSGCDSVQSYAAVGKHHPTWTTRVDGSGRVKPWQGERLFGGVYRRQDLEPAYVPDGGVVVVRRSVLDAAADKPDLPHAFLGDDHRAVTTKPGEVVDIDHPIDLAVADQMLRQATTVGQ